LIRTDYKSPLFFLKVNVFAFFFCENLAVYLVFGTAVFYNVARRRGVAHALAAVVVLRALLTEAAELFGGFVNFAVDAIETEAYLYNIVKDNAEEYE
jgi:hypothetical protein